MVWYAEQGKDISIFRDATGSREKRGTTFCGKLEQHDSGTGTLYIKLLATRLRYGYSVYQTSGNTTQVRGTQVLSTYIHRYISRETYVQVGPSTDWVWLA